MQKPLIIALLLLACLFSKTKAQEVEINLVPNPSFEEITKQPCLWMQRKRTFDRYVNHWSTPTETNPDVYSMNSESDCYANPVKHNGGIQTPRTGSVMLGMKIFGYGGLGKGHVHWHEYIQVKLKEPLKVGQKYYAEVYVQRQHASSKASNNIGFLFNMEETDTKTRHPICEQPQINHTKMIKSKLPMWEKVSGVFTADLPYEYMIIGNFYGNHETIWEHMPKGVNDAQYYFDDVLVRPAEIGEEETPKPPACVPPKPFVKVKVTDTKTNDLEEIDYEEGNKIELSNIYFETDKAVLLPESEEELDKMVTILYNYPYMEIEVQGHTDNVGEPAYNQKLSEERARAVVDYLIKEKVKASRLSANGYGETQPIAKNDTDEGKEKNRRVEFIVKKAK